MVGKYVHITGGEMVGLQIPKKAAIFTGTGDLFTAIYLAWSELGVKVNMHCCSCVVCTRPVSIMLENLSIMLSGISQKSSLLCSSISLLCL